MKTHSLIGMPWAITEAGARSALLGIKRAHDFLPKQTLPTRPKEDAYGSPLEQMRQEGNAVVIPCKGIMLNSADPLYKLFGFVSHQDVAADLETAASMKPDVIVVDFDTPGGSATGTPELAGLANEISKQCILVGYTSGQMASAGYYAACGMSQVMASPSAIVGCVGTVLERMDTSEFWESMGIEFQRFASGKYKGMGSPEIPLTDDQKAFIQDFVDTSGGMFSDFVITHRGDIQASDLQGQFFHGETAKEKGFVDMLQPSLSAVLKLFER